jgi:DNA-binding transcriptional LysR family regulator
MKVTFHQLEVFACVARRLSFTRAAEELGLAQPTVSAQMRQLTDAVGLPLFEQFGKSVQLTGAGQELLATSKELLAIWSRFEMTVADLTGVKRGDLKLACATTAKYFTPDLLGPFCAAHPEVEVGLAIENHDALVERLRGHEDDLTIMTLLPGDIDIDALPFRDNPLVCVAPANHPLAKRSAVPLAALHAERFILRESASETRQRVDQYFAGRHFVPEVRMELGSNEAVKHVVAAGLGISILSRDALDGAPENDRLAVLDVQGFPLSGTWFAVTVRGRRLSPVAAAFLEHLRQASAARTPDRAKSKIVKTR